MTDEFRQLSPGVIIGKSFYGGPQGWLPETWRRQRDTNYFMLFQVRAPACGACGNACMSWCKWCVFVLPLTPANTPTHTHTHNTPTHTPQSCTNDGKVPYRPEDRDLPIIGN